MSELHLKTDEEIAIMREAGLIVAEALQAMRDAVRPGVSTQALDDIVMAVYRDHGATPAFLNYAPAHKTPYPAAITASINNELVHGIPHADRLLQEGDIISLDTACFHKGMVGDAAFTMAVGEVPPAVERLMKVGEEALWLAIETSRVGHKISDVARIVAKHAASKGYSVAREYTGHGVGRAMHEPPQVPNWWPRGHKQRGLFWQDYDLQPGMTFAIEPMVIAGRSELMELDDGWTVATRDGSLCVHFEHTIAVTDGDPLVLTLPEPV